MSLASYFRDRRNAVIQRMVNEARTEARAEGREEGREEARAEGRQELFQELSSKSRDELLATFGHGSGNGQYPGKSGETPAAPDQ